MTFLTLPLLFFSIALAPGTAESEPSTEGMMFKIHIIPGIATDFKIDNVSSFYMTVDPAEPNSTVVVKKPRGYPVWVLGEGADPGGRRVRVSFINGTILDIPYYMSPHVRHEIGSSGVLFHDSATTECFVEYTIHLYQHSKTLRVPFGYSNPPVRLASEPMPAECAGQSLLEPPFPSPYRQAYDHGIVPSTVACNEGLVLHLRGGEPLCLRPDTRDLLLGRGYIEPPPVPFVPSPERVDAGRPRP